MRLSRRRTVPADGDAEVKPWYQSRTIWANVILAALFLVNHTTGTIPADVAGAAAAVLNVALRFVTSTAVTAQ